MCVQVARSTTKHWLLVGPHAVLPSLERTDDNRRDTAFPAAERARPQAHADGGEQSRRQSHSVAPRGRATAQPEHTGCGMFEGGGGVAGGRRKAKDEIARIVGRVEHGQLDLVEHTPGWEELRWTGWFSEQQISRGLHKAQVRASRCAPPPLPRPKTSLTDRDVR